MFQKVEHTIKLKKLEPFTIFVFGDVHYGVDGLHAVDHFDEFLRHAKAAKNAHFIEMGDSLDVVSGSERIAFSNRAIHLQTINTIEARVFRSLADEYLKKIDFMEGRMLFKLNGNHYAEFSDGTTTDDIIADALGCVRPPGVCCMCSVKVEYHGSRTSLEFFAHHGKGGTTIAPVEKMQQTSPHSNIFLMGHNHGLEVKKVSGLVPKTGTQVGDMTVIFARTGSMLKAYVSGESSYVCDGMFRPSELGVLRLTCTPKRDKRENGKGFHIQVEATI